MRLFLIVLMGFGLCAPAWADTCIDNTRAVATAGARLIAPDADIVEFCAPCGDTTARPFAMGLVKVGQTDVGDEGSFEVTVNGKTVDLAYLYACTAADAGRTCQDIGLTVKCTDDQDVPALLPPTALPQ